MNNRTEVGIGGRAYLPPPGFTFDDQPVKHHNGLYVAPGRRVVAGSWPVTPELCDDTSGQGVWIVVDDDSAGGWRQVSTESLEGQLLICPTCGLDCT